MASPRSAAEAPLASRMTGAVVVFSLAALVDFAMLVLTEPAPAGRALFGACAAMLGAFTLAGQAWVLGSFVCGRLLLGRRTASGLVATVRDLPGRLYRERHDERDASRVAALTAASVWVCLAGPASVFIIAYLVENRNGALLIAGTSVVLQGVAALIALLPAWYCFVLVRYLLGALAKRSVPRPHTAGLLLAFLGFGAAGLVSLLFLMRQTVVQVEGIPILLGLSAMTLEALLALWWPLRPVPRVAVLAAPVGSLALVLAGARSEAAYAAVIQGNGARHLMHALGMLSDFDRDGSPYLPRRSDCRPFDPRAYPGAREIPGNGRDENCDGLDTAWLGGVYQARPHPLPYLGKPHLVLVTFDALRVDHLGFMGYERDTSPNLDRLAKSAVVFERAFSQDSGTVPSFTSLVAGKTPFQARYAGAGWPPVLHPDESPLPELLQKAGYTTHRIMCGGVSALGRGFTRAEDTCQTKKKKPAAKRAVDRAIQMVDELSTAPGPFFLWVHLYDPHDPYQNYSTRSFGKRNIDKYDEAIAYADEHLGRLLTRLDALDRARPLFIAVGADHGENFGEHGTAPHARTLYREVTHVPLLFSGPGVKPRRIEALAALNDIYPTFVELARATVPRGCTLRSQVPVMFGEPPDAARVVFQENSFSVPRRHVRAALRGRYHYLMDLTTGVDELYDFVGDPGEKKNLLGSGIPEEQELRGNLRQFLTTSEFPASW